VKEPAVPDSLGHARWPLFLIQLGLASYIALRGPTGPVAMHLDLAGNVNRWGTGQEAAAAMLLLAFVTLLTLSVFRSHRFGDASRGNRLVIASAYLCSLVTMAWVTAILAAMGLGRLNDGQLVETPAQWGVALLHVTFIVLGAFNGKTTPNRFVGVRNRWTFASRLAWDKANRLFGYLMLTGGVAGLLTLPFVSEAVAWAWAMALPLASCLWTTVESWRVWKLDPSGGADVSTDA
jgi:uncharacterized membrane protein